MGRYRDHRSPRTDRYDGDHEPQGSEPDYFQRRPQGSAAASPTVAIVQEAGLPALDGEVLWFNAEKGFGFVRMSDGSDVFLHMSKLQRAGYSALSEGALMKVRLELGQKGPQVSEVVSVSIGGLGPCNPANAPSGIAELDQGRQGAEGIGLVRRYDPVKGFGFIRLDEGSQDVFVHATTLARSGLTALDVGQTVVVGYGHGQKGLEARSVQLR